MSRSDTNRTIFATEWISKGFHDWRQMAKEHDARLVVDELYYSFESWAVK